MPAPDLAVSAPGEDLGSDKDAGLVTIVWGSAKGLTTATALKDPSGAGHDRFGRALAAASGVRDGGSVPGGSTLPGARPGSTLPGTCRGAPLGAPARTPGVLRAYSGVRPLPPGWDRWDVSQVGGKGAVPDGGPPSGGG